MANITPIVSNSQALITPGYPMVSVAHSNPVALIEEKQTSGNSLVTTVKQSSLVQSGHTSDRLV